jgi:hypothetical protein
MPTVENGRVYYSADELRYTSFEAEQIVSKAAHCVRLAKIHERSALRCLEQDWADLAIKGHHAAGHCWVASVVEWLPLFGVDPERLSAERVEWLSYKNRRR